MSVDDCGRVWLEIAGVDGQHAWPHQVSPSEQEGLHVLLYVNLDGAGLQLWVLPLEECLLEKEVERGLQWQVRRQLVAVLAEENRVGTSGVVSQAGAHNLADSHLGTILVIVFVIQ